ncbi:bifunctional acetate--CoA ligase family protein/GNAT family N-acetyltransferase [Devosia nitrariae]|uniref:N-acetyltransferase n=1 Tax=Devosia nitrariae TaxID=2071872 RepID=A0ABQ5WAH0_9HYPH|nr:bifunctional acetate--CoA ligase family protein/GNAT family N-acetyltransferase [Devosia nitrariae]GLQ56641.1 N-acetyltransferase [Devosia nitrariae]
MTIRNLAASLAPQSVAIIGASAREGSVGQVVLANVVAGGFKGRIYPVNPKYTELAGMPCYPRVAELPEAPDLCVIATPARTVPSLIDEIGRTGGRLVVVITAGIDAALRREMLAAARPHLLRIIGPNVIGLLAPRVSLNASFTHLAPIEGKLGLISQSGAIVSSIVDWAAAEGIGFSQIYSLGDMADVDVGDCLNMLATDGQTAAIIMYLESIPEIRKFMSAARSAGTIKPVIAIKPGRHTEAAKAAQTHTGALAGADRAVDAALRRAGIIRVDDLEDLFNAAETTARFAPLRSARVAVVTNGGGAGVLAVDELLDRGCALAELGNQTIENLDRVLPAAWSRTNPVDIIGDAPPARYAAALEAVAADPQVDAVMVMNCPTGLASPVGAAEAVAQMVDRGMIHGRPVLANWLGKFAAEPARDILQKAGVATFETPEGAAEAVEFLTKWADLRRIMERVPERHAAFATDPETARAVFKTVAGDARRLLTEPEAKAVLAAYGVPVTRTLVARTLEEVGQAAEKLGAGRIVVKLLSRTITHKSDIGGVALGLVGADEAKDAAVRIRQRIANLGREAEIDGFAVQPMVELDMAEEVIIGVDRDPVIGPTILFGAGGTAVEVLDDTATGIAPLDPVLAGDLIDRTRIGRLLAGYRDKPPADREAIVRALLAVSQLIVDFPCIEALDINPLLVDEHGLIALDARVVIDPARLDEPAPNPDLAVRPYPSGWERRVTLRSQDYLVRPIRPVDVRLYPDFLARVTAEHMRLRFLSPVRTLSPELLARLTQLDYDREIALVAIEEPCEALAGIARYAADPDKTFAEFGILVRSDLHGRGLGRFLMERLLDYGRTDGIGRIEGLILRENTGMIGLCRELGFQVATADDPALVKAVIDLAGAGPQFSPFTHSASANAR